MLCIEVIQHPGSLRLSNHLIQCFYLDIECAKSSSTVKKTAKYFVDVVDELSANEGGHLRRNGIINKLQKYSNKKIVTLKKGK